MAWEKILSEATVTDNKVTLSEMTKLGKYAFKPPVTYNISCSLTNVTGAAANPTKIAEDGTANLTFTADSGYSLPDSITVTGATYTYTKSTGVVALSAPTGAVSITIVGEVKTSSPLCFTSTASTGWNAVGIYVTGTPTLSQNFSYSTDGSTWTTLSTGNAITLQNAGDKIYIKGNNPNGLSESNSVYYRIQVFGSISASGNIMSLIDDGACTTKVIPNNYCFYKLFYQLNLVSAANIELPATTLTSHCYDSMFNNSNKLVIAPAVIPAASAEYCCYQMFQFCTVLLTPPSLPATALADYCYANMFYACSALTTPPALPATTMKLFCYDYMFRDCTSLTSVPALPATTLYTHCYYGIFEGCTSLQVNDSPVSGTAEQAWTIPTSGTIVKTYKQGRMFSNCAGTRASDDMAGEAGQSYTYYTQNTPVA